MSAVKDGASVELLIAENERNSALVVALCVALEAILLDPYGCPMCDSGKLRGHKPHWDECGYAKAETALKALRA